MAFKYDKLWSLIKTKGMSKSDLRDKIKTSQVTIVNMGRNKNVPLDVIDRICKALNCTPDDIMEYVSEDQPKLKTKLKRGEIYYAELYGSDGSEMGNVRPVLIIQNDIANEHSPMTIAIPISANLNNRTPLPTHVKITANSKNKLPDASLIIMEQIRAIDKRRLKGKIGELNSDEMKLVEIAAKIALGFDNE